MIDKDERQRALRAVDSIDPEKGRDRGPPVVFGLTLEERVALGIEAVEPVSLGKGYATVDVTRRKYTHPLDLYWEQKRLGKGKDNDWRRDVGIRLADDFVVAAAAARLTSTYEVRGTGGHDRWSLKQIEARDRLKIVFRGTRNEWGKWAYPPVLNPMGARIAMHVCCLGLGVNSFDQAMVESATTAWRKGHAMCRLVEALDDLLVFHRQRFDRGVA